MAGQSMIPMYSPHGDSIAALIARQGDIQARGAERSGELWSNVVNQLGQIGANAYSGYKQDQEQRKIGAAVSGALGDNGFDPEKFQAGLGQLPPELRTRALQSFSDISSHWDAAKQLQEKAQQAQRNALGVSAYHAQSYFDMPDGGISALTPIIAHAKANGQDTTQAEDLLSKATTAMQQAQQSGDPNQVEWTVRSFKQQATPFLQQLQSGMDADTRDKLAQAEERMAKATGKGPKANDLGTYLGMKYPGRDVSTLKPEEYLAAKEEFEGTKTKPSTPDKVLDTTTNKLSFATPEQIAAANGRFVPIDTRDVEARIAQAAQGGDMKTYRALLKVQRDIAGARHIDSEGGKPIQIATVNEQGQPITTFISPQHARDIAAGTADAIVKAPGAQEQSRMASARNSIESGEKILGELKTPEFRAQVGAVMGRYNSLMTAAGEGDPTAQYLVGAIKSFAALQGPVHGYRAIQFSKDIEHLLNTKQDPDALIGGLNGVLTASYTVAHTKPGAVSLAKGESDLSKKHGGQ